ncbi:hypothetical protein KC19_2G257000 [Ceratodon purpureus]|uniref:Uncharacterized protein n=1 Tax=Ceratodon purpureus TaxID=3225 RepID=A0A8T0IZ46_CERPU|nr:hypothetical protein KC19_2G257000 [Ceratodon purpureus]
MTVPPQICRMQKAMGMMVRMVEQMMVVERIDVEETRTSASSCISITSYFEHFRRTRSTFRDFAHIWMREMLSFQNKMIQFTHSLVTKVGF